MSRGYVISAPRLYKGRGGLYISGVDFGCFSTWYRHCEGLWEREEQTDFTLFVVYICTLLSFVNLNINRLYAGTEVAPDTNKGIE